jgi:general nucleoside transport system permease protein
MNDSMPFALALSAGMVRCATPVLFAVLGEIVTEQSGVINLGVEGIMLAGALTGVITCVVTGNAYLAVAAAMFIGAVLGAWHAFLCVTLKANQIASGIALTILGTGLTGLIGSYYVGQAISGLRILPIPGLELIPCIGPVLFQQDILVYISFLMVPAIWFFIYRTQAGLALQSAGSDPAAASNAGIRVARVRFGATIFGGALAALGGAYLSLVLTEGWTEGMTAGRGLVAVGLVMFAGWNPWRGMVGAYLFGLAISLQLRLQTTGISISPYLLGMGPYFLVIGALVISAWRGRLNNIRIPLALGRPHETQT